MCGVRIGSGPSETEAGAIAAAIGEHVGERVAVYVGTADEPAAVFEGGDDAAASDTDDADAPAEGRTPGADPGDLDGVIPTYRTRATTPAP